LNPLGAGAAATASVASVAPGVDPAPARQPSRHAYSRLCAILSKASLALAVVGLLAVVVCVQTQVVGRYVFNDSPTWTEPLALLIVLYVTALGVAVGVRDAGHIGLESFAVLLPERWRLRLEFVIHALVGLFGAIMAWSAWRWAVLKWDDIRPMLGVPVGVDYLALAIAGVLIVLFSIEHVVAAVRGEDVVPSWH
jgi:TRAP-type C4-dicarboxylate transport system permease small subunit